MPPHRKRIEFQWKPYNAIDMAAIERMRENFPKPTKLPPEAWFMTGINYYPEIDAVNWDDSTLERYLFDTCGGVRNFGRFRIWIDWFLYILPDLIIRCASHEDSNLYETTINYFLNVYQFELYDEHFLFYGDIFNTLMQVLMQTRFWNDDDIFATCWTDPIEELRPETDGRALEATMVFCIKFLTPQDIPIWVQSIAEIPGEKWKAKVQNWLKKFKKMMRWIDNPDLYHQYVIKRPIELLSHFEFHNLAWGDAFLCLREGDSLHHLLPEKHIQTFLAEAEKYPFFNS
jgi:hypothetical protein